MHATNTLIGNWKLEYNRSKGKGEKRSSLNLIMAAAASNSNIGGLNLKETYFISHGSPMLSVDDAIPARQFLKSFRERLLSEKPQSILLVSAHWETSHPAVNAISGPSDTIYDFYNFPKPLYQVLIYTNASIFSNFSSFLHFSTLVRMRFVVSP